MKFRRVFGTLTTLALSVAPMEALLAQAGATQLAASDSVSYDIPASSLSRALMRFAEQSGLQLVYSASLTDQLASTGLSGRYTPREALAKLLGGTGLTYRFTDSRNVTVERALVGNGTRALGPVRVEGRDIPSTAGISGSKDPTATEGTGSYTSNALSIASKAPQSIKDTPQSVSVVTLQRMQDQNLTDFTSLMSQSTGVSVVTGTDGMTPTFYSRGFSVQRLQIDGGAPLDIRSGINYSFVPQIDMAVYDHAEVLRGADGLFNGYGGPGGVINLTRKRPLEHSQVVVDAQVGSWDNYRTVIDASGPLGFDGRLRGRGVLAYQDQNFFYEVASNTTSVAYGILEYDLLPTTTLSAGFNKTQENAVPFFGGVARYQNGADLKLPRDQCNCFPWNRHDFDTAEVFAGFEHAASEQWKLKLNVTHSDQQRSFKYGYVTLAVNPVTRAGPIMAASMGDRASEQLAADLTVDGGFELFGHRQVLIVGANYAEVDGAGYKSYSSASSGSRVIDVFTFDPNDPVYSEPASGLPSTLYPEWGRKQWNAYATLQLTVWEPMHLNVGLRYTRYEFGQIQQNLCTNTAGCIDGGTRTAVGEVRATSTTRYDTHDLGWPPSLSLVCDLSPTLSIYGSYADIYQDQAELVDAAGSSIDPVTGSNLEAGIKWSGRNGRLDAALSVYRLEQENFGLFLGYGDHEATEGYLPDGVHRCCYNNDLDQTYVSQGADLEVTGEVLPGWQLAAGYTYNENEREGAGAGSSQGQPLQTKVPEHLFKLWSSYQFATGEWLQRLSIGGGVNAQSKGYFNGPVCTLFRTNPNGSVVCDTANGGSKRYDFTQGAYAVLSARLAYRIDARWNAALNVSNLTDRTYYQTVGDVNLGNWYGEPRSFMLTVRGSF